MEIKMSYKPETDEHIVLIKFDSGYLRTKCNALPLGMRKLITQEQGLGIIEDAILMAHGYQLNPEH